MFPQQQRCSCVVFELEDLRGAPLYLDPSDIPSAQCRRFCGERPDGPVIALALKTMGGIRVHSLLLLASYVTFLEALLPSTGG